MGARDMVAFLSASWSSGAATALSLPPPLRGRVRASGSHELRPFPEPPLSLALPHKGGGNTAECVAMLLPTIDGASRDATSTSIGAVDSSEAATALSLPPPLWGRVGERGSHELRPPLRPPLSL